MEGSSEIPCFDPEDLFEKKRQIKYRDDNFELPTIDNFYKETKWEVSKFMKIKKALNDAKSRLDHFELGKWHRHTRSMNNAAKILPHLRSAFNPEFCTWAWSKFTECLNTFDVIPKVALDLYKENYLTEINSVHICEAPGAFISATNHFLKQNLPDAKWNWVATTLNPYFEGNDIGQMVNEDRLILMSWNNWTFLQDGTGNILCGDNIRHFVETFLPCKVSFNTYVHFVTADGSIDCQDNPSEQEALVAHLHFGEIITALKVLGTGGSFVLKIFTFLECETLCHLYLLSSTFKEVHLFKPATSKEGNSEVYVTCTGFLGGEKFRDVLDTLLNYVDDEGQTSCKALFPFTSIDSEFLRRVEEAATFFTETQAVIIHRNISTFPPIGDVYKAINERQMVVMEMYMEKYGVTILDKSAALFRGYTKLMSNGGLSSLHIDPWKSMSFESLAERLTRPVKGFKEHLEFIYQKTEWYSHNVKPLNFTLKEYFGECRVQSGKPYKYIMSSRFCYSRLLSLRHELRQLFLRHRHFLSICLKPIRLHVCSEPENQITVQRKLFSITGIALEHFKIKTKMMCFHETAKNFMLRTDLEVTQKRISTFLQSLKTLAIGNSMFLCEFPLLSRLHVGLVFLLTTIFDKVSIHLRPETDMQGILLFGFKGFASHQDSLQEDLAIVQADLESGLNQVPQEAVLEVVSIQELCSTNHWESIAQYNTFNLVKSINAFIAEGRVSFVHGSCPPPDLIL